MFSVEIEIVLTLLQNVSNSGVVGGDGGVGGCGWGCCGVGGVGGGGVFGCDGVGDGVGDGGDSDTTTTNPTVAYILQQSYHNFNFFGKRTLFCFGHIWVKFCSNFMILDIFQQPRRRAFQKCPYF